jgi:Fe-S cluster assembly protein SufD
MGSGPELVAADDAAIAAASKAIGSAQGDSQVIAHLRAGAADLAARLPLPQPHRERPWKYLDVTGMRFAGYAPRPGRSSTTVTGAGPGTTVSDFAGATGATLATIEKHLSMSVPVARSKFTALHYALLSEGVLVEAAPNTETAAPIRIVREYREGGQIAAPHTLIVTGANSHVTVIEDYRSSDADILVLPVVEVVPGPNSVVRYTALHRWGSQTRAFLEQHVVTAPGSEFTGLSVVTGGRVVKSHLRSSLEGRGSSSELFGLVLGSDKQHVDFYTVQDHIGADTRSDLLIKAALQDSSRSVYYGLTRVGLGAKNADANQVNRNLLLSRTAKADSDPVLEILTNDVIRVSHGATAGPVDEEQLFYLQARGLTRVDAEALLVRAFLGQVLDRMPDEGLRAELEATIEERLAVAG